MNTRKTKIICTVGPAIESEEMLIKMFNAGMDVARLNFSHGSHEECLRRIKLVQSASAKVGKYIGIMLDTKGPEIRIGTFENNECYYEKGDVITLYNYDIPGNKQGFYVNCPDFFNDIQVNNEVLIDDGKISLTVLSKDENTIKCVVNTPGKLKNKKGINVPGVSLSMPFISKKDYEDIKFGCEQGIDLIALSFVRRAEDVIEVKNLIKTFTKKKIEIISKIENQEALDNLDDILNESDGVMVARGDLGVEVAPEAVPLYQKQIIQKANKLGKPVITATHMMESMISAPRPTRAEASDVANAILDGTDAVMLSGESAIGLYPVESVSYMSKIALATEATINYETKLQESQKFAQSTKNDAIGACISQCCITLNDVQAILAFTETGGTAKRICKFRPSAPIIACTDKAETCRRLSYYWGVYPVITKYVNDISMCDEIAIDVARSLNIEKDSTIIITSGFGMRHGVTNTIRIIEVE